MAKEELGRRRSSGPRPANVPNSMMPVWVILWLTTAR